MRGRQGAGRCRGVRDCRGARGSRGAGTCRGVGCRRGGGEARARPVAGVARRRVGCLRWRAGAAVKPLACGACRVCHENFPTFTREIGIADGSGVTSGNAVITRGNGSACRHGRRLTGVADPGFGLFWLGIAPLRSFPWGSAPSGARRRNDARRRCHLPTAHAPHLHQIHPGTHKPLWKEFHQSCNLDVTYV